MLHGDDEIDADDFLGTEDEFEAGDSRTDDFLADKDQEGPRRNHRDEDGSAPTRRSFCADRYASNGSFMSWYVHHHPDRPPITQEMVRQWSREKNEQRKKGVAENIYIGQRANHPRFKAWFSEHHPELDWADLLENRVAREIIDEFDVFTDQPTVDEFCKIAFDRTIKDREWPYEFRQWLANNFSLCDPKDVTIEIIESWKAYDGERKCAYDAKCELNFDLMDDVERSAGAEQWRYEGHRDRRFIPNTEAEWDALVKRHAMRRGPEMAKAREKADAKAKVEARIEELEAFELPAIEGPIPSLLRDSEAQEKHDKTVRRLKLMWLAQFNELPDDVKSAWNAYHIGEKWHDDEADVRGCICLTRRDTPDVDADNADAVADGLDDPAFAKFRSFNERARQALEEADTELANILAPPADAHVPHKGSTLDEIPDEEPRWVIPNLIPEGLSVIYGAPKEGKSLWLQKLAACAAGEILFDGSEIAHGRVVYVTADPGARKPEFKRHQSVIHERLGIPHNKNLIVVDDPVILNDPVSVDAFLKKHPGRFAIVAIDALYQCMTGSAAQDVTIMEVGKGLLTIMRKTGAAVLLIHHAPRNSQHPFGSVFLEAMLDAQIRVERNDDVVTVRAELLKNGELPKKPLVYRIEDGFYLAPITPEAAGNAAKTAPASAERHSQMLALLPTEPIRELEARRLVEHLLTGKSPAAKRQQWCRFLRVMAESGHISRRSGLVRRVPKREE